MYTIYVDGNLLYSPERISDGYVVTSAVLTKEVNCADGLEIIVPETNPAYSNIDLMASKIVVYQDNNIVFIGRAITAKRSMYNLFTIHCEGGLAYWNDLLATGYKSDNFSTSMFSNYARNYFNTAPKVSIINRTPRGSRPGENDHTVPSQINRHQKNILQLFNEDVLTEYGGTSYVVYSGAKVSGTDTDIIYFYHYKSGEEPINSQTIQFGENILEIAQDIDYSNLRTAYYARAKKKSSVTGAIGIQYLPDATYVYPQGTSDPSTRIYVPSIEAVQKYGLIVENLFFDMTDSTTPTLYVRTGEYVREKSFGQVSFTCSAIDLHLLNSNVSPIVVGNRNRIISEPHGIDSTVLCSSSSIDLLDPRNSKYTFGTTTDLISAMTNPVSILRNSKNINSILALLSDSSST